jgi:acyl dehydratase
VLERHASIAGSSAARRVLCRPASSRPRRAPWSWSNYGSNKIRFISPVPAGARTKLHQRLVNAEEPKDGGIRVTSEMTIEVEGSKQPVMVAETMSVVY